MQFFTESCIPAIDFSGSLWYNSISRINKEGGLHDKEIFRKKFCKF